MAGKGVSRPVLRFFTAVASMTVLWACSKGLPGQSAEAPKAPVATAKAQAEAAVVKAGAGKAAVPAGFAVTSFLKPDRPLRPGDFVWNAAGAPNAPLRIVVDIEAQRLYVYRGNVEIGRSSIIYGDDDKPTPLGTFPILEKDKDHESNIYDAAMPYMLRLTWDGVAIHVSEVEDWYATNGCIGVPEDFAALLFDQVKLGDTVLVTNKWMPEVYDA